MNQNSARRLSSDRAGVSRFSMETRGARRWKMSGDSAMDSRLLLSALLPRTSRDSSAPRHDARHGLHCSLSAAADLSPARSWSHARGWWCSGLAFSSSLRPTSRTLSQLTS